MASSACWSASTESTDIPVVRDAGGQGGPGPLQGAVDRGHAGVEQLGDLGGLPAQHLAQDQHGPLAGREVLQGGHEGQPDGLAGRGQIRRVGVDAQDPVVGDRRHPQVLRQHGAEVGGVRRRRGPEVDGPGPALPAPEHVQAHVGGDAVQPRAESRPTLVGVDGPPGPDHRLLDGVLRFETGAEHPVAVAGEFAPVGLELALDGLRTNRGATEVSAEVKGSRTASHMRRG